MAALSAICLLHVLGHPTCSDASCMSNESCSEWSCMPLGWIATGTEGEGHVPGSPNCVVSVGDRLDQLVGLPVYWCALCKRLHGKRQIMQAGSCNYSTTLLRNTPHCVVLSTAGSVPMPLKCLSPSRWNPPSRRYLAADRCALRSQTHASALPGRQTAAPPACSAAGVGRWVSTDLGAPETAAIREKETVSRPRSLS